MRKYDKQSNICGKIIENARLTKDLSREELAYQLQLSGINVDRTFVYRVEKQSSILKDFELIAICNILDIDFNKLKSLMNKEH